MDTGSKDNAAAETVQILTTTHFALQTARSSTVFESTGRATVFLTTVSTSLIALGFIAQATSLSEAFYLFTYLFLGTLAFIGWVTFQRLVQTNVEDMIWASGIVRVVRSYMVRYPEMKSLFALRPGEDESSLFDVHGDRVPPLLLTTTASMVGVVTSVVLGVLAGVASFRVAGLTRSMGLAAGIVVFAASESLHLRWERRRWMGWDQGIRK